MVKSAAHTRCAQWRVGHHETEHCLAHSFEAWCRWGREQLRMVLSAKQQKSHLTTLVSARARNQEHIPQRQVMHHKVEHCLAKNRLTIALVRSRTRNDMVKNSIEHEAADSVQCNDWEIRTCTQRHITTQSIGLRLCSTVFATCRHQLEPSPPAKVLAGMRNGQQQIRNHGHVYSTTTDYSNAQYCDRMDVSSGIRRQARCQHV
jgi:hypothetical protein